jgi:hypothetical protein
MTLNFLGLQGGYKMIVTIFNDEMLKFNNKNILDSLKVTRAPDKRLKIKNAHRIKDIDGMLEFLKLYHEEDDIDVFTTPSDFTLGGEKYINLHYTQLIKNFQVELTPEELINLVIENACIHLYYDTWYKELVLNYVEECGN